MGGGRKGSLHFFFKICSFQSFSPPKQEEKNKDPLFILSFSYSMAVSSLRGTFPLFCPFLSLSHSFLCPYLSPSLYAKEGLVCCTVIGSGRAKMCLDVY